MKIKLIIITTICFFHLNLQAQCWQMIEAGALHSMAIKSDGSLWTWGSNIKGQLGDGTNIYHNSPIAIDTSNWQRITAGELHSTALKLDGTLWSWGFNQYGQLGDGTTTDRYSPVQIGTDNDWQNVATNYFNTVGIKTDGTLWAWGRNNNGQIGDGTLADKNSPVQISADTTWQSVAIGWNFVIALKSDGTMWGWGANYWGQLGDGTDLIIKFPTQINIDNNWQRIAAGYDYSLAIKTNGTLWVFGRNNLGQLGDGTYTDRNIPTQIGLDNNWQTVATGTDFSFAIKTDGTLWAWGRNHYGQLGDGTTIDRIYPIQVGTDTDWEMVTAGQDFAIATKTDGTHWAWGDNYFGQFGNGTYTSHDSPVEVTGCPVFVVEGTACDYANDINPLFGHATDLPQVSTLYDNSGFISVGDPKIGYDCWADGPALTHFRWYRFTGDGSTYRIRSIQCNSNSYNDDTQVAIYSGNCDNLAPVACNEDENISADNFNFMVELPTDQGLEYFLLVDGANNLVGEFCLEVTKLAPSGIAEIERSAIGLYPNPTSGIVHIQNLEADLVQVLDNTGRLVFSKAKPGNYVDLTNLPAGMYCLKITDGTGVYSEKLIKE